MKRFIHTLLMAVMMLPMSSFAAEGWPAGYSGVMLQGFYWDSFNDSKWTALSAQASNMKGYFDLMWVPQSAKAQSSPSMGYDPLYWFSNYNSSFGTEAELISMIQTLQANGIGTIADIVINHRGNVSNWVDFPAETYNGTTYQLKSTDICADDDGGATKDWATKNGYSLSSNNDTGEGWGGMRDLDHNSSNVQNNVKAYLQMLIDKFGYAGFRYDMVKGYRGSFTGIYNEAVNPAFSVGEYFDGNKSSVESWISSTRRNGVIQSGAFDFPFRYTVRDAANNGNWALLGNTSVMADADYRQYAVTFIENHDTEYRSASSAQDPLRKDTLAANAYLLAMPGTPCVFFKHWLEHGQAIKAMIHVRKLAGITNTSSYTQLAATAGYYAVKVQGTNSELVAVVGTDADSYAPGADYVEVLSGRHYRYFMSKDTENVFPDKESGEYTGAPLSVKLNATTTATDAKIVYTLDGSTPNAGSNAVSIGTTIEIPAGTTTLTAGLLVGGTVRGIVTREYTVQEEEPFDAYTITVYVNGDNAGWTSYINFHTWGNYRPGTSWPGDRVTESIVVDGKTWFYKTYDITRADDAVNFVFSNGTSATAGNDQTVDVTGINQDTFLEVSSTKDGAGHYLVNTVTTGIEGPQVTPLPTDDRWYNLSGMRIERPTKKGIYIHQGRKVIIR